MSDLSTRISEILGGHYICPCGRDFDGFPHCVCGVAGQPWKDHVTALIIEAITPDIGKVESAIFAALQNNRRNVQRDGVKWSEITDLARAAVSTMGIEEKP